MPTAPLEPVPEPRDEMERVARMGAVSFIEKLCYCLNDYTYSTRSNVPGGMDCTDFMNSLSDVVKFCKERPDWTLNIVNKVFVEYGPGYAPQNELDRLRDMVRQFEEESGLKLDEYGYQNGNLARAVKAVLAHDDATRAYNQATNQLENVANALGRAEREVLELKKSVDFSTGD